MALSPMLDWALSHTVQIVTYEERIPQLYFGQYYVDMVNGKCTGIALCMVKKHTLRGITKQHCNIPSLPLKASTQGGRFISNEATGQDSVKGTAG
ncbi:hypothetical protein AV530_012621 [Patagioenas fasciata monilis]|uniref:Uncharacterized protein n=1 Tax=Patagioenas fasciata monilis TaxID=372326 RepID=A0A1V4JC10_PATFA|nr:hypothetical protein AV530_012621 [Patagioenas fasciata monilis]